MPSAFDANPVLCGRVAAVRQANLRLRPVEAGLRETREYGDQARGRSEKSGKLRVQLA